MEANIQRLDAQVNPAYTDLLGVNLCALPVEDVIERITASIISQKKIYLAYANAYAINLAFEQPWFREFLNNAALTYCDGFGVKWGARLLGQEIPERYTPPDWFPRLAAVCAQRKFTLYFLGARPGIAEKCAAQLRAQFSGLMITGTHHGYFDKTQGSSENRIVIQTVNHANPDILVVGLGMPLQERWLMENWKHLNTRVALPVGAMFDYLTGDLQRAPHWMTDHGLEWLGRLLVEPRRLSRRYILGIPLFLWRLFKQRIGFL